MTTPRTASPDERVGVSVEILEPRPGHDPVTVPDEDRTAVGNVRYRGGVPLVVTAAPGPVLRSNGPVRIQQRGRLAVKARQATPGGARPVHLRAPPCPG